MLNGNWCWGCHGISLNWDNIPRKLCIRYGTKCLKGARWWQKLCLPCTHRGNMSISAMMNLKNSTSGKDSILSIARLHRYQCCCAEPISADNHISCIDHLESGSNLYVFADIISQSWPHILACVVRKALYQEIKFILHPNSHATIRNVS